MSPTSIMIFEALAVGAPPPRYSPKSIAALIKRGLIEQTGERTLGHDAFGLVKVPVYEVPIHAHMQWCAWCAENVSDKEINNAAE